MQNCTRLIYISHLSLLMYLRSSVRVGTKKFTDGHRKVGQWQKCSSTFIPKTC
jgi:hypothetical protein